MIAAREGRTWTFFNVSQQAARDRTWGHDPMWVYRAGIVTYWLLLPCGALGLVVLRRRRRPLLPLLAPFVVVALATAVTYGQPRLRASAEVPLVLLAAVGIDAAWRRFQRRARTCHVDAE